MALFSRRKDSPEVGDASAQSETQPADTVAEIRPGRRRSVGQLLRETREGYGSDIPRVAAALRIRGAYLEAIEEGRYDRLPGPVYALGFVRAYAVHLGLDGEEAVRRFKLEAEGFEAQRDLSFPVPLAERSMPGGAMVLAALILAVCAYGIWYYLSSTTRPRPERVSAVPTELAKPAAAPTPASTTPPASAVVPVPAPAPAAGTAPAATAAGSPPAAAGAASPAPAAASPTSQASPAVVAAPPAPAAAAPAASSVPPTNPASPAAASAPVPTPSTPASASPAAPGASPGSPAADSAPPPVPPEGAKAAAPAPGADQSHVYGLANGDTHILIRAISDSWIQVRDKDQHPIFTRELHVGDLYHVPDEAGLSMKTGKGVGLVITVDGKQTPPIGGAVRDNVVLDPARLLAGTAVE
ncbi:MAG TPA: RodZ domain-containing protein [Stellaceae bacterium]|nr:RodZ domain-containing protein [Stellaceae bacterium]